jgi:hypothetical protein
MDDDVYTGQGRQFSEQNLRTPHALAAERILTTAKCHGLEVTMELPARSTLKP